MESFHDLADEIANLEHRVSDAIFDTLREQVAFGRVRAGQGTRTPALKGSPQPAEGRDGVARDH
jgi:hypothetical protein